MKSKGLSFGEALMVIKKGGRVRSESMNGHTWWYLSGEVIKERTKYLSRTVNAGVIGRYVMGVGRYGLESWSVVDTDEGWCVVDDLPFSGPIGARKSLIKFRDLFKKRILNDYQDNFVDKSQVVYELDRLLGDLDGESR